MIRSVEEAPNLESHAAAFHADRRRSTPTGSVGFAAFRESAAEFAAHYKGGFLHARNDDDALGFRQQVLRNSLSGVAMISEKTSEDSFSRSCGVSAIMTLVARTTNVAVRSARIDYLLSSTIMQGHWPNAAR